MSIETRTPIRYTSSTSVNSDDSNSLSSTEHYNENSKNPVELPRGLEGDIDDVQGKVKRLQFEDLPASASNPYYNVRIKTLSGKNYPMTDDESYKEKHLYDALSAKDLILNPMGASIYSADDFLYAKNFGKLPINRMITLRRFAHPVFDDIFSKAKQSEPDICRLIGYSDQEINKISDIGSFSCGMKWKPVESTSEAGRMEGNQSGYGGIAGTVLKYIDPKYGNEAVKGPNAMAIDPQHDTNRVYGPVDSIASVHMRDVGINFEQDMKLVFEFQMKSINGVNQKAAFIDLLSNILLMSTNDAKFWGGARYWVGAQPSKYMNDLKSLNPKNWEDFVTKSSQEMGSYFKSMTKNAGTAKDMLKNIANNALNLGLGRLLNALGRPGIPVMNSLLTGNPVGMWHLTVGNPMNPFLAMGDLIITNSTIKFGDELGYDDFPTEIFVEIDIKHPKPKGRAEIESMFNAGKGRTYLKPKDVHKRKRSLGSALENSDKKSASTLGSIKTETQINDSAFGEYDASDVERNQDAVWSFMQTTK